MVINTFDGLFLGPFFVVAPVFNAKDSHTPTASIVTLHIQKEPFLPYFFHIILQIASNDAGKVFKQLR